MLSKNRIIYCFILVVGLSLLVAAVLFDWDSINSYQLQNTDTLSYVRAVVLSVEEESLEDDTIDSQLQLGQQELVVKLLSGENAGTEVEITNYLTRVHNIYAKKGTRVIVCADEPEDAEGYYTIYNYDRSLGMVLLVLIFAAVMLMVGGWKGLKSLAGVTYSIGLFIFVLLPGIYHGFPAVGLSVFVVIMSTIFAVVLLNGVDRKALSGILATFFGTLLIAVLFGAFSYILHVSGFNTDAAETLTVVSDSTGLTIRGLLFSSIIISGLGAVMDVAVSLTAALDELIRVREDKIMTSVEIFRSAMNIGRDMIGTMSNTLILAFAGTALNTFLCLEAYGYSAERLLSSDYLTVELSQALCATTGVVLTVPATGLIFILIYRKHMNSMDITGE